MKISELIPGRRYSVGRGSQQYLVLEAAMWHKRYQYSLPGIPGHMVYARGKNRSGMYTEAWGVPCLVLDRDGVEVPRHTRETPFIINPKKFVGLWEEKEAEYKRYDALVQKRKDELEAQRTASRKKAVLIGEVLTGLGAEGHKVDTYGDGSVYIKASAFDSVLAALQGPEQGVAKAMKQATEEMNKHMAAYKEQCDSEVATYKENMVETIKDLLYELDVTWDEWFSGKEVTL